MNKTGDILLSLNEKEFIVGSLHESRRIDGRRLYDMRNIKISFGNEDGHAEVQLGTTRVFAIVSCQVMEPYRDRPTEGFFNFNVEMSPMADPSFEIGRPSESAIELLRVVERGLRESRAIDTEALCLVAGEKVFSIRCDIHIVDNGGNLMDCASIATIAALLHFRRPYVTIVGNEVTVHSPEDRLPVKLSIHHIPISITFGLFEDGDIVVVDPSLKEELVMDGRMTMTLNSHREICAVQKAGGTPIPVQTVLECSRIAGVKAEEITEIIKKALQQDAQRKTKKFPESSTPKTTPSATKEKAAASKQETTVFQEFQTFSNATKVYARDTQQQDSQEKMEVEGNTSKKDSEEPSIPSKQAMETDKKKTSAVIQNIVETKEEEVDDLSLALKKKPKKKPKKNV